MVKLRNEKGERIYKKLTIKVFSPDNKRHYRSHQTAPPKQGFGPDNIDAILEQTAANIEREFPGFEYSLVPLSPHEFNFVSRGPKNRELL